MSNEVQSFNPWFAIWLRPKATIRRIVATNVRHHVFLLAMLAGVAGALSRRTLFASQDGADAILALILSLVLGPIGGIFSLFLGGALLSWSSRLIGGVSVTPVVRAALAWSYVPLIFGQLLVIPEMILFGREIFSTNKPQFHAKIASDPQFATFAVSAIYFLAGLSLLFLFWAIMLLLHTLAEVQQFSVWKALLAVVIALLVVATPLTLLLGGIFLLTSI